MQETLSPLTDRSEKDLGLTDSMEHVGPSFKVILWEHIAKNSERAAEAVADCDVIAMETVGVPSEEERKKFDAAATMYVSSGGSKADMKKARRIIQRHGGGAMTGLLEELKGSDKRIVTIDVNEGDPALIELNKGYQTLNRAGENAHYMPSNKMRELLDKGARDIGRGNLRRETLAIEQIQELAESYDGKNVKIGVLTGSVHTPISHSLAKHYPTERSHIETRRYKGQQERESHYFEPFGQMVRHYNLSPDTPIPEALANRAILHTVQLAAMGRGVAVSNEYRARLLENMPDEKISDTILALDGMKSRVRARLQPKHTLAKMDAEIEKRLAEIEHEKNS